MTAPVEELPDRRGFVEWVLLAALLLYTAFVHHGVGPPPKGIPQHWYEPRTFFHDYGLLSLLIQTTPRALVTTTLPALALMAGVFATGRSAVARALAVSCVVACPLFAFYGVAAPFVWEFFGWRGSAVLITFSLCLGFAIAAPFLAASWLRLRWPLRVAVYLPFVLALLAFVRNATGTDPSLKFSISPWPVVPVFGIEVGALFVAAALAGVALALGGMARVAGRGTPPKPVGLVGAVLLGLAVPGALLWVGSRLGMFPFHVGPRTVGVVIATCAVLTLLVATLRVRGRTQVLVRRARRVAVGAALVGVPLLAGQTWARYDYFVTRERDAREIIDALANYYEREFIYPDTLTELVEAGDLEEVPEPSIGFDFLYDAEFRYQSFGTSFLLEFPAPRWVECAYTPPYEYEDDEEEDDDFFPGGLSDTEEELGSAEDAGGEADGAEPGDDGEGLGEAWSCPSKPPELW